jgi:glycosyltransferase involved in cell wall biosynthesis
MQARVPRVSVLTAVHNGERFLEATIASILAQEFEDFEYILVDDGSTDSSPAILAQWASRDARIRLLRNERTLNPAGALNCALAAARGEFVAVIDHDDLAYPARLGAQVAYLDAHPEIGVIGTQAMTIDNEGKEGHAMPFPLYPLLARWRIYLHVPVLHSSAMMRRHLVEQVGGYSTAMWAACDYDLMARLLEITEITNLPETLTAYRRSPHQVSSTFYQKQTGQVLLYVQALVTKRFGINRRRLPALVSLYFASRGNRLGGEDSAVDEASLVDAATLLEELSEHFLATTPMSDDERDLIVRDVAWYLLLLAVVHRRPLRARSRELVARAVSLDPQIWQRSYTKKTLRALRARSRTPAEATVAT